MKFFKEILDFVLNNNFEKSNKEQYTKEINEFNYNGVAIFATGSFFISSLMFIISFFIKEMSPGTYICAIFSIICLLILLSLKIINKNDCKRIKTVYYVFSFSMFIFYEIIGVRYATDSLAAAICGVYILLPLFNINNPRKYSIFISVLTVYLIFDSFITKDVKYAMIDCVDCSLFCLTSCLLCYYITNNQISIIANRNKIKEERDTDYLTKLNNRSVVEENVNESLSVNNMGMMLLIDLDNFKSVNDKYGHAAGDDALVRFANLLKKNFRKNDLIARIGGDEFIVFVENIPNGDWAIDKCKKIINDVHHKLLINNKKVLGCSIGVVYTKDNSKDYFELYQAADKAMYEAKNNGKNGYAIYKG